MKIDFYVYAYFRADTGEPCYIGKGRGKRWREHFTTSSNPRLRNIIAKAGGEIPHVKIRQGLSEAAAYEVEIALITAIGRGKNGPLVNMTDGGEGQTGRVMSPEGREKIRSAKLGRTLTPEHRAKIGAAQRGKILSEATRKKMSAAAQGKPKSESHRAKLSIASTGKTHSMPLESRAKMSHDRRGIPRSPETITKMSASLKGRISPYRGKTHSDEVRAKISAKVRGRTLTAEHRAKIAAGGRGKKPSPETRSKLSASAIARWARRKSSEIGP